MYKYYFKKDENNNVTHYFNSSIEKPDIDAIYDQDREERHYHLDILNGNGEYKYKYENSNIIEKLDIDKLEEIKTKILERLKTKGAYLLSNALVLDNLVSGTAFNQAKTFLKNKKIDIQNGTVILELLDIEVSIDNQIISSENQIANNI